MQDEKNGRVVQHTAKKVRTGEHSAATAQHENHDGVNPLRSGSGANEDEQSSTSQAPRQRRPRASRPSTKRPLSAYNIFFSEERAKIKKDPTLANLSFGQFGKIVAERWDKLPEHEKVELQTRAEQSRQEYFKKVMSQAPVYGSNNSFIPNRGDRGIEIGVIRAAAKLLQTHEKSIHRPENYDSSRRVPSGSTSTTYLWKEGNSNNDPPPLTHGGRLPGHLYSPQVEELLQKLGGAGEQGGAGPTDTEVPGTDVAYAIDFSSTALEESTRLSMQIKEQGNLHRS